MKNKQTSKYDSYKEDPRGRRCLQCEKEFLCTEESHRFCTRECEDKYMHRAMLIGRALLEGRLNLNYYSPEQKGYVLTLPTERCVNFCGIRTIEEFHGRGCGGCTYFMSTVLSDEDLDSVDQEIHGPKPDREESSGRRQSSSEQKED